MKLKNVREIAIHKYVKLQQKVSNNFRRLKNTFKDNLLQLNGLLCSSKLSYFQIKGQHTCYVLNIIS